MRNLKFILKFVLACVLGFVLQFTLHEMGHALFAFLTGNEVVDITFGVVSYATINVTNVDSIPFISIGAFVFPVMICMILEFIPYVFVKMIYNNVNGQENTVAFGTYEDGVVMMMYDSVVIKKM